MQVNKNYYDIYKLIHKIEEFERKYIRTKVKGD